jgi:hypothetical protein
MTDSEGHERAEHGTATTLLHPERHGKQPTHSWVDAMEGA